MSRRRPTLRHYLRRRWRTAGFLVVLFLGALLLLAVTDRGHDPLWEVRAPLVHQFALSPAGDIVYVLVKDDENGPIVRLEARDGRTGGILWKTEMDETRALIAADDEGVALATDFPEALATFYDTDGSLRWQKAIEGGSPRALVTEDARVAIALQASAGEDQVIVVEDGRIVRAPSFDGFVNALDLRAGHLAVGTSAGELVLFEPRGRLLHTARLDLDILSVRLAGNAQTLMAGGYARGDTNSSGGVAFVDFSVKDVVQWTQETAAGIGLVDISADGSRAIAIEESGARHSLHAYATRDANETWAKLLAGIVGRDAAGHGGAAISPAGDTVVVGTLKEGLRVFDGETGDALWTYDSDGTTLVAFRQALPPQFVANARLVQNGPLEALLLFSPAREPVSATFAAGAVVAGMVIVGAGLILLGVGYWRWRTSG